MNDLQIGKWLTAIDPLYMEDGEALPMLTVGKRYRILDMSIDEVVIMNDLGEDHFFKIDGLNQFFTGKAVPKDTSGKEKKALSNLLKQIK